MDRLSYNVDKAHVDEEVGSPQGIFAMINEEKSERTPEGISEDRGKMEKESNLFEKLG